MDWNKEEKVGDEVKDGVFEEAGDDKKGFDVENVEVLSSILGVTAKYFVMKLLET